MIRKMIAAGLLLAASVPAAATIDFEGLSEGSLATATYPEVTFRNDFPARSLSVIHSLGNKRLCAIGALFGCTGELVATFSTPVRDLSVDVFGVNYSDDIVTFVLNFANGTSATRDFTNLLLGSTANTLNLGSTLPIANFVLTSDDSNGVSIDNATFAAVPEPASWAMMIAGFGMAGFAMRRRQGKLAVA